MVGSTSLGFYDLVLVGEMIENVIKTRKIQNAASASGVVKKPYVAYGKKKEGEANEIIIIREKALTYHAPYQQVAAVSQNQQPFTIPTDQQEAQQQPYQ